MLKTVDLIKLDQNLKASPALDKNQFPTSSFSNRKTEPYEVKIPRTDWL
jgi:hypothetical protein